MYPNAHRSPWFYVVLALLCCLSTLPAHSFHFPWDQGHDTTRPLASTEPGPCEGPSCANDPCNEGGSLGSPVYLATGHFIWTETDIVLAGRPQLAVSRTYNSHDPRVGLLGNGWSLSCDSALIETVRFNADDGSPAPVPQVVRRLPNGKRYLYVQQPDGSFAAPGVFDVVTRQAGNALRITRRDGSYSLYNSLGRLTSEVDRNGNIVNYTYDAQGRLTRKADTNGRSLSYVYNANGLVSAIRDHTGREWDYGYDANANLVAVTDPLNGVREYEYEAFQRPGDGNVYSHLTRVIDATGITETVVNYTDVRVASYSHYQNVYSYRYDTANRRVTKTDSRGSVWVYTYNQTGQATQIVAPLNRTTTFERDSNSLVTRMVDPSGTQYLYTYDPFSNLLTQTDARGTLSLTYDNAKPWPLSVRSRSGRLSTFRYNSAGNPVAVVDPAGATTTLEWSAQGDLQRITNALGHQSSFTYNTQGMPLTATDPLGRTSEYEYDALNHLTQVTNAAGEVVSYQYDLLDRLIASTDGTGETTRYGYDAAGRLTEITAPNNQTVQYAYDALGRLAQRTFYDGTLTRYLYRVDHLIDRITLPNNVAISHTYDAAKRLLRRTVGSEESFVYEYNLRDEITSVANRSGTVTFDYDPFGRLLSETTNGQTFTYGYNADDEMIQLDALGISQTQQFDGRGLLSQIEVNGTRYEYVYDALTRLTAISRSDTLDSTLNYDAASQLTRIAHGTGQRSHHYAYDPAGRISQWQGIAGETRDYGYDNAGRLTSAQSPTRPETFAYDALGNRQQHNARFDAANRIIQDDHFTYRYDVNGNRTHKTSTTTGAVELYTYNSLGQLTRYRSYPNGTSSPATADYRYTYGPLGQRWSKENSLDNTFTQFYWSGSHLIGETTNGTLRRYTLDGLTPTGFIENGETYHFLRDHLGTAHEIIDSSGATVWQADYESFGQANETLSTVTNHLRFAGQYHDRESGLYYNYFRDYDPNLGRYLQSDPIGLASGINTYAYVLNNPVNLIDPLGLVSIAEHLPRSLPKFPKLPGIPAPPGAAQVCGAAVIGIGIGTEIYENYGDGIQSIIDSVFGPPVYNSESQDKSRQSKPKNAPPGTKPIDAVPGLSKDDVHKIKRGVRAGAKDWTGITPDGDVITTNPDGSAENHGPYPEHLP